VFTPFKDCRSSSLAALDRDPDVEEEEFDGAQEAVIRAMKKQKVIVRFVILHQRKQRDARGGDALERC